MGENWPDSRYLAISCQAACATNHHGQIGCAERLALPANDGKPENLTYRRIFAANNAKAVVPSP